MAIVVKDTTLSLLQEKLRILMNDHSDTLIDGSCEDYADYKHKAGVIQGLALAERELLGIDEMLYRDED